MFDKSLASILWDKEGPGHPFSQGGSFMKKLGERSVVIDPFGEVPCPCFQENNSVFSQIQFVGEKKHQVHLGSSQILSQTLYHPSLTAKL